MEMHQVRYFLATVGELNFTKAAEKCNVTQPSLTRAIKQLEDELGGDLFRRERRSHSSPMSPAMASSACPALRNSTTCGAVPRSNFTSSRTLR